MSISRPAALALLAWLALTEPVSAQPRLDAPAGPTVAQQGSAVYRFDAFTLASRDGKRHYHVQVGIPKRSPPRAGYPVVYLLDGGAAIEALDEDLLTRLDAGGAPPVLVAIGYVGQPRFDQQARAFDYTPPDPRNPQVVDDQGRPGGRADDFLRLVEAGIKPRIARLTRIDRHRQTLWGHSYGGLLVLHAAFTGMVRFQHFDAADPALWWNYGSILPEAQALIERKQRASSTIDILVGGGKRHANGDPARQNPMRTSLPDGAAQNLAEQLQAAGITVRFGKCASASHGAMFGISLRRTLLAAAGSNASEPGPCAPPKP